jgi:hypothetical protein
MSRVTLGLAGQSRVTVTMFNNANEDKNINASSIDNVKAQLTVAMKRLRADGTRKPFKSHCDGTVLFPV